MLPKWELIIKNWVDCYFGESRSQHEPIVNTECLVNIISHLRENLNLDESKSSVLEAHTIEQFILEKYPNFKFESGNLQANSENDIYLVASLLLFFVCVNSKDLDIKNAMCSKLSGDDQEIILKFSKSLMECPSISRRNVETAITEACGQQMAKDTGHVTVAETPPALRSLHGEVRRLQAALEAERFDRNYLQEELSRTNSRVEKLVKDKERYKLDIMNLTAKISMSGGDENDSRATDLPSEETAKLSRQLHDMEERLVKTQEQLDDASYERDDLKKKLEDLKQDRDKWILMQQNEVARSAQLADELETERRQMQSLKDLVSELRQHNRLNGLDTSLLECDDPDASLPSLAHNLSICSEACASIVEVQLSEEKAKVDLLKQQILTLQRENEQLQFAIEEDNSSHEVILKEKDCVVEKLERQIKIHTAQLEALRREHEAVNLSLANYKLETKETIDSKDAEITKLSESLSVLQMQYHELETVRDVINKKVSDLGKEMSDLATKYKNEKEKLLKSFEHVEGKFAKLVNENEGIYKKLLDEKATNDILQKEKNRQQENCKVLLAEKHDLSNSVSMLEQQLVDAMSLNKELQEKQTVLAEEKETFEKTLINQLKNVKKKLSKEGARTKKTILEKESITNELEELKAAKLIADQNLTDAEIVKKELTIQICELSESKITLEKQFVNEKDALNNEKQILIKKLSEIESSNSMLLKNNECLATENVAITQDLLALKKIQEELVESRKILELEKEEFAKSLDQEKIIYNNLVRENNEVVDNLNMLKEQYLSETKAQQDQNKKIIERSRDLQCQLGEKHKYIDQLSTTLHEGLEKLVGMIKTKQLNNEALLKLIDIESLDTSLEDKCNLLIELVNMLPNEMSKREELQVALERELTIQTELKDVMNQKDEQICKLQETTRSLQESLEQTKKELTKEVTSHAHELQKKIKEMDLLKKENTTLTNELNNLKVQLETKVHSLKEKIIDNENITDKLKETYECQIGNLNLVTNKLTNFVKEKSAELDAMKKEKEKLQQVVEEKDLAIKTLENEIKAEKQNQEKLAIDFESERQILQNMVSVTESVMEDQKVAHNAALYEKEKLYTLLQEENVRVKQEWENNRSILETNIQKQNDELAIMREELTALRLVKEDMENEIKEQKDTLKNEIVYLKAEIDKKENYLSKLQEDNSKLESTAHTYKENMLSFEQKLQKLKEDNSNLVDEQELLKWDKSRLEGEIDRLNEYIKLLTEEKQKCKSDNNELNLGMQSLKAENATMADDIFKLKEENSYLGGELKKFENENMSKTDELINLQKQCNLLENDLGKLKSDNNELDLVVQRLTTENKDTSEKLCKLKNDNSQLEAIVQRIKQENKNMADELDTLKKQISLLDEELVKSRKDNSNSSQELVKLQIYNTELGGEVNKFKSANIQLEDDLNKVKYNYKQLEEEMNKSKKDCMQLEDDMNKLRNANIQLDCDYIKLKKDNSQLEEELRKLKKYSSNMSEEFDKLKKDKSELSEEFDKLKKDNVDLATDMARSRKDNLIVAENLEKLKHVIIELEEEMSKLKKDKTELEEEAAKLKKYNMDLEIHLGKLKLANSDLESVSDKLRKDISEITDEVAKLKKHNALSEDKILELRSGIEETNKKSDNLVKCNKELTNEIDELKKKNIDYSDEISKITKEKAEISETMDTLKKNNIDLTNKIATHNNVIQNLEQAIKEEQDKYRILREDTANEKVTLSHKCDILQDYHDKADKELGERQKEIASLQKEVQTLNMKVEVCEEESKAKDRLISKMSKEKDAIINDVNEQLRDEKDMRDKCMKELNEKIATITELKHNFNVMNNEREALNILKSENAELIKAVGYTKTYSVRRQDTTASQKYSGPFAERELRDLHHQVDNTSDLTQSSIESLNTINDLEKIIIDKNRSLTTLQSDITYLKTLMAESENKLLDVTKELEVSKENCQQLSTQLKKIVQQKNEEITDLKKHVSKMSATENRATQIIKVSAKYQTIILKRIAEIKSNTVLKELTNFGNSNNSDNELRRSLTAGSITMEDLENFLETTERHLKKCSDKQLVLQKERDRLTEVNRINESEIISLKKFLTELSVSFQTFSSVKDLYAQKLSRVISVQRTVRREILSLDGHVTDASLLKLERGYAAAMQDLAECAMNLERWVERCISRNISSEKIKQAFVNDIERVSMAPTSVQNAGLEVQLDELEASFRRLLEEVSTAARGGAQADPQASTVLEVRAEYEDKLNRMKAKMKQLYTEQISVFKDKQKEEIAALERELSRAKEKLAQSSRVYEEHIRGLTTELWTVGEKFLMKKDEAEWLRRKQRSGSLMSLQHVHSSGIVPAPDMGRPSDSHSLRSLPTHNTGNKRAEGRGMHMSDEEGEVFDNRCLAELDTPQGARARDPAAGLAGPAPGQGPTPGLRLSELRWRNSLCPPHLKSSYPAETQFTQALDEEEIKAMNAASSAGSRQRKEVGIIAYKKPGPPTPSKQAGRLSATDSELRESLRVEAEPHPSRKTSTPSRIRSLFRSSKTETTEGTPRSRRLSSIFRKK